MKKTELLQKIKELDGLTADEKSYLINLVNTKKKYGLVWEDKPEDVEEQLREYLPVLKEVKGRAILNGDEHPNHILIEGDNLHALTALSFTHEGKVDVMYFDPPYNTGKENEFKYNDKWVDAEDSFRHSKWLSFMYKRLKIAHSLLTDNGILFVSIDDNEVAQLKMLLDEIFDKHSSNPKNTNSLGVLVWDLGTGTSAGHFTRSNEFVLAYCKNKSLLENFSGGEGVIDDRAQKKISEKNKASEYTFPKGTKVEAEEGFELTGSWGGQEKTTLINGRFICENGVLKEEVTLEAGWTSRNQMDSFFNGNPTIDSKGQTVLEFYFKNNGKIYCRKERDKINPPTVLRNIATTKQGTSTLKDIFNGEEPIKFVKPVQLVKYFLNLGSQNALILDFFAGSGTTLHATMQLNTDDGGKRQCIIVTNNENNICEEVTYERNRRVIEGYTNAKGAAVEGLKNNNLRYFKSEFAPRETSLKNKRELTKLATELLCIKEDCYTDCTAEIIGGKDSWLGIFTNGRGQYLCVIYDDSRIDEGVEALQRLIDFKNPEPPVKVYVFSNGQYPYTEEFEEVLERITLCALPDAIYKAYHNVLPKPQRTVIPELEEPTAQEVETLVEKTPELGLFD